VHENAWNEFVTQTLESVGSMVAVLHYVPASVLSNAHLRQAPTKGETDKSPIRQGLWLEKLVEEIAKENSLATVAGRMLETNELDVVSVAHDSLIIFECKDTNFGQNDFYVLTMKAQLVGAHVMVIVTTRDVSENVKRALERVSQQEFRQRMFLIEASGSDEIRTQVSEVFAELERASRRIASSRERRLIGRSRFLRG